ncbi:unnamed protein product [Gordionus sp. m RMFG-2023]
MSRTPLENINKLEEVEKQIAQILQYSGLLLNEMSKEKSVAKQVENLNNQFTKEIEKVYIELLSNINYLVEISSGQQHEGSSYARMKSLQLSLNSLDIIQNQLSEQL